MPSVNSRFSRFLEPILIEIGLALDARQTRVLEAHYAALQLWNCKINLTAIRDPAEIAQRHFGEALFLAKALGTSPDRLLDIGSGAGFPGMPVAVCHPATRVTLLEPVGKKFAFLKEVSRSLPNVSVLQGRLAAVEGVFDWATVRGVSVAPILKDLGVRARHVAVLTTVDAASEWSAIDEFRWQESLTLPWGKQRILLLGELSSKNPRSTWNA